jgi:Protein of unknown function (DUF433)
VTWQENKPACVRWTDPKTCRRVTFHAPTKDRDAQLRSDRRPQTRNSAIRKLGTRIPADAVLDDAQDGYTAEQIVAETYPSLPLDHAKRIFDYACERANAPHPA